MKQIHYTSSNINKLISKLNLINANYCNQDIITIYDLSIKDAILYVYAIQSNDHYKDYIEGIITKDIIINQYFTNRRKVDEGNMVIKGLTDLSSDEEILKSKVLSNQRLFWVEGLFKK